MIHTDKNALLCDLAETYGIYDIGLLPVKTVAILCCGLRETSRIMMKINGMQIPTDILLLAHAIDRLSILVWQNTKDGSKGRNKPESMVDALLKASSKEKKWNVDKFNSLEEFKARWNEIINRKG